MSRSAYAAVSIVLLVLSLGAGRFVRGEELPSDAPRFTAAGELQLPANYREWVWLSSGLGMAYGPNAGTAENPPFDNVFVNPQAHRSFLKNGVWPDGTMFVLEIRASQGKASINRNGHFQGELRAIEAEVKTDGKWSFYQIKAPYQSGTRFPNNASCYTCHATNGAVDNTFVQFYPTLIEVARANGTYKEAKTE